LAKEKKRRPTETNSRVRSAEKSSKDCSINAPRGGGGAQQLQRPEPSRITSRRMSRACPNRSSRHFPRSDPRTELHPKKHAESDFRESDLRERRESPRGHPNRRYEGDFSDRKTSP
jgi:hypothetical protein